ncbi:MAG: YicC family protein [Rhodobacteraceae bacterium]|nr:YicC family protein [Paracoccaceae bacterium]
MTFQSMTGFASLAGAAGEFQWVWEVRSVNGRGLDLRLRLPDGFEALEAPVRAEFGRLFSRGSITVGLKLAGIGAQAVPRVNRAQLEATLAAAQEVSDLAAAREMPLAPFSALDLLGFRNVLEIEAAPLAENTEVLAAVTAEIGPLAAALAEARAQEGAGLRALLAERVDRIAELAAAARETAEARAARRGAVLRERVQALLESTAIADEARLSQELALIAVKADVSEEIDRLETHVAAARDLLGGEGPRGRRLDFLTQEFNREANTLCSKAGATDLTAIGLEMKVVIDQMREQVQNVE